MDIFRISILGNETSFKKPPKTRRSQWTLSGRIGGAMVKFGTIGYGGTFVSSAYLYIGRL